MGTRVLKKVDAIVREEMNRSGALEVFMPVTQPAALWEESGRFEQYGQNCYALKDRHDNPLYWVQRTKKSLPPIWHAMS